MGTYGQRWRWRASIRLRMELHLRTVYPAALTRDELARDLDISLESCDFARWILEGEGVVMRVESGDTPHVGHRRKGLFRAVGPLDEPVPQACEAQMMLFG